MNIDIIMPSCQTKPFESLIMIFLNLELQNFSLYILMNIQRNKKIVVETCIKYYVIGEFLLRLCYMVFL